MKPRKILHHGKTRWLVESYADGKRVRRFFETEKEAKSFIARMLREHTSLGASWASVPDAARSEMMAAWERSVRGSYSLMQACEFFERRRKESETIPKDVSDAVEEYLALKEKQNLKPITLEYMGASLRKFGAMHPSIKLCEMSPTLVDKYLDDRGGGAKSRKSRLGELSSFFKWAASHGFVSENPCTSIPRPMLTIATPEVLRVEEVKKLLEATRSEDAELLPLFVLCLFAGLRTGEAQSSEWKMINLSGGFVTVSPHASKTRRRRIVAISDNLKSWLMLGGTLPQRERVDDRIRKVRLAAGIDHWPRNVMRHSFCSYHLAAFGSAAQTALAAGHSENILFHHYRELVTPEEAKKYWEIKP